MCVLIHYSMQSESMIMLHKVKPPPLFPSALSGLGSIGYCPCSWKAEVIQMLIQQAVYGLVKNVS